MPRDKQALSLSVQMPGAASEVESKPRLNPNRLRFSKLNDGGVGLRAGSIPAGQTTFSLNLSSLSICLSFGAFNSLLLHVIQGPLPEMWLDDLPCFDRQILEDT